MNNKTNKFKGELPSEIDDENISIEEDLKNEEIMNKSYVNDGLCENWTYENHSNLVTEFIEENNKQFKEYCKERYKGFQNEN